MNAVMLRWKRRLPFSAAQREVHAAGVQAGCLLHTTLRERERHRPSDMFYQSETHQSRGILKLCWRLMVAQRLPKMSYLPQFAPRVDTIPIESGVLIFLANVL